MVVFSVFKVCVLLYSDRVFWVCVDWYDSGMRQGLQVQFVYFQKTTTGKYRIKLAAYLMD